MGLFSNKKRYIALLLATTLAVASSQQVVFAAKSVSELEEEKENLQEEIDSLDSELVSLLTEIDSLEAEISDCESEIAELQVELEAAQAAEEKQYQQMKLRMKYMYEQGEQSILTMFLESGSLSDFLNRVEYANAVYEYDRTLLESYEATQVEIGEMQSSLETEKASLQSQKSTLSAKQSSLNSMIAAKQSQMEDFDEQLEAAREAARKAAEEEAARRAAEQAAANASAVTPSGGSSSSDSSNSGSSSNAPSTPDSNPSPSTNIGGSSVVSYAMQFVGNPYVWGGNSLTNGCDCSGFVVQVYAHFGINLSGSRNSAALRSVGQAVSYNNIQPGDIVCYAGHVGIYAGGGVIVEAQSTRAGITANRSVTCKPILAIRRVV